MAAQDVRLAEEEAAFAGAGAGAGATTGRPHPEKSGTREATENEAAAQSKAEVETISPTIEISPILHYVLDVELKVIHKETVVPLPT